MNNLMKFPKSHVGKTVQDKIMSFSNDAFGTIRTIEIDGDPWFVGKDVADALGYERGRKAVQDRVHLEDKDEVPIRDAIGRMQKTTIINESGLYSLILSSKLPTAKQFKRWVTSEILPSIRKHGAYVTNELLNDSELLIEALKKLKEEQVKRKELQKTVTVLASKADYYDDVLNSSALVSIGKIAKDYGLTSQKMNKMLHSYGVQFKQGNMWLLYDRYASEGYAQSKTYHNKHGVTKMQTCWTQKGRAFIDRIMRDNGVFPIVKQQQA